ncbi:hypothetical protein NQ315_006770 [Exocentrus adspersus]|uniref:Uncharacterized protein n=1 Tax=Exocentrus adspersus TaxID=1586481 RepID=A0AAV8WBP3_9CUCU|nr:hypothetical protein NQ315_006770 [Exocentrus adspersus]
MTEIPSNVPAKKDHSKKLNPLKGIFVTCICAIGLRYWLMLSKYQSVIANHIEVSTPLNSWKRVLEGLHLLSIGVDPYKGDLLHETPLSLLIYRTLLDVFQQKIHWLFITFDIATGILLYLTAKKYVNELYADEEKNKHSFSKDRDVGFVLSCLPCFGHLVNYCQQGFLVGVIFLISSSLAPILWYLWIYCNSANANFYFGVTLAFAIAQIFLLTDILFAQVKREFMLKHGKDRKINGEEGILCLE